MPRERFSGCEARWAGRQRKGDQGNGAGAERLNRGEPLLV